MKAFSLNNTVGWAYIQHFSPLRSVQTKQPSSFPNSSLHSEASTRNKEILHIAPTIKAVRASANIFTHKHEPQNKAPVQMFLFHSPFFLWMCPYSGKVKGTNVWRTITRKVTLKKTQKTYSPTSISHNPNVHRSPLSIFVLNCRRLRCFRLACWGLRTIYSWSRLLW
jgi:hypothetical protein